MSETYYIDDGNEILYLKGFIEQGSETSDNSQPLYIYPFDKKYGKKNNISDNIIEIAGNMQITGLYNYNETTNIAEIENVTFFKEDKEDTVKLLALMYRLLNEGKNVLYKPKTTTPYIYTHFISNLDTLYKNTEFAFVPIFNGNKNKYNDIYKPGINCEECIFISKNSTFMKKFITLFESLRDISNYLDYGNYQLLSSVRISYLVVNKSVKKTIPVTVTDSMTGGDLKNINFEDEYLKAMDYIENFKSQKAGKKTRKTLRMKKRMNKTLKKRKH
jgi:hypothetical protein